MNPARKSSDAIPAPWNGAQMMEENRIGRGLQSARKALGITQSDVCRSLAGMGFSLTAAGLSRWESGASTPNPYQLLALCELYGISDPTSALLGRPGATKSTTSLPRIRRLNAEGLRKLRDYEEDLVASGRYLPVHTSQSEATAADVPSNIVPFVTKPMRIYDLRVSAGRGVQLLDEEDYEEVDFPEDEVPAQADFGLYVYGDSMQPEFQDGDLVWVKATKDIQRRDIGIFSLDGEGYIKQFDYVRGQNRVMYPALVSLNPKYPPMLLHEDSNFHVLGKVIR